jgi:hypothetical protein
LDTQILKDRLQEGLGIMIAGASRERDVIKVVAVGGVEPPTPRI